MEMKEEGKLVVRGRAEIDTRAPFNSVKEAVQLFGETVLANGIYALKLQQSNAKEKESSEDRESEPKMGERDEPMTRELEETRLELEKAREEAEKMGRTMLSLKQELEQTKSQLQWLKAKELMLSQNHQIRVQNAQQTEAKMIKINSTKTVGDEDDEEGNGKKRTVKFASPPTLTKVISTKEEKTKNKNKSLVPIIRWFISKKKGNKQSQSSP